MKFSTIFKKKSLKVKNQKIYMNQKKLLSIFEKDEVKKIITKKFLKYKILKITKLTFTHTVFESFSN